MRKFARVIFFLSLAPLCALLSFALGRAIHSSASLDAFWIPAGAGALCWLAVFCLLPKPVWTYVMGHELTHAFWTWLCGGKVHGFKVSAKGGHVIASKTNFLISLSPYFFPIYVVLIAGFYAAGNWWWGWEKHASWFHLLVGAAYSFHVTMTAYALRIPQSDLKREGLMFSVVVIWLGNVLALLIAICALTNSVSARRLAELAWGDAQYAARWIQLQAAKLR